MALDLLVHGTDLSLAAYASLCMAALAGSLVSASIGLGGGVLTLAVMALVLPPTVLLPIHGVVQASSNGFRALLLRPHIRLHILLPFVAGTGLGVGVGGNLAISLEVWLLQLILALFVLYATWVRVSQQPPRQLEILWLWHRQRLRHDVRRWNWTTGRSLCEGGL